MVYVWRACVPHVTHVSKHVNRLSFVPFSVNCGKTMRGNGIAEGEIDAPKIDTRYRTYVYTYDALTYR